MEKINFIKSSIADHRVSEKTFLKVRA